MHQTPNTQKEAIQTAPSWLIPATMAIVSGIAGWIAGYYILSGLSLGFMEILYLFLCLCLAACLQVYIHEGGHYVFGKLTGYKFVSFRIGNMFFFREHGRLKRKRFHLVGTGGQCLMQAPATGDSYSFPYVLYNLGGSLANLAVSLLGLVLHYFVPMHWVFSVFLLSMFFVGIIYALVNGIPARIQGMANDGYNAMRLAQDMDARRAFWQQTQIAALLSSGVRLRDMPQEWFELPEQANLHDSLVCAVGVMQSSYYKDRGEFAKARQASEFMLDHAPGLLLVHRNELLCELLFYEMIGECRPEEIDRLYSPALRKYVKATMGYVSRQRLLYGYELLVNKAEGKARQQLVKFERAARFYPYESEIAKERELLAVIAETAQRRNNTSTAASQ